MVPADSARVWTLRLLTALAALGLIAGAEVLLRVVPGLGPEPLLVQRASEGDKTLHAVNRLYSQRFFFGERGRLRASGQMAERYFFEPVPANLYRVVFVGASTVQGFPHPRRLSAASFLEQMLADVLPERTVQVFNLGITSIASFAVAQVVEDALALEPDLVVVYTGHNEFYGIYGVGDHPTPRYNRLEYALRQLHLSHLAQRMVGLFDDSPSSATDLLKLMAERGTVPLQSPRREAAERHLRDNLGRIAEMCQEAGVSLVLCTLAANDAGFAPAGSAETELKRESARLWAEWVDDAASRLTRDYIALEAAEEALDLLHKAAELSEQHAWLWYLRGRALERLGQVEEAYPVFRKARDLDTMPWRAPTTHSEIIRAQARVPGVIVADVDSAFQAAAAPQGVGWPWMVDHVHFSVPGQILMARVLLDRIAALAAAEGVRVDRERLRDDAAYRRDLGDLPAERAMLYQKMGKMLSQAPMDRYNGHNVRYLQQLMAMEWQRLTPAEQRGIKAWTQQAPLALAVADQLFAEQDFRGAQRDYRAARREAPFTRRGDLWAALQWGWSIKMQDKPYTLEQKEEIETALQRAALLAHDPAIEPAFIDFVRGQLHHLLEEHRPALIHLERAFLVVDFRRKYAISLFRALAAELVWADRIEDARRYARIASEEEQQIQYFLQLVEEQERL